MIFILTVIHVLDYNVMEDDTRLSNLETKGQQSKEVT